MGDKKPSYDRLHYDDLQEPWDRYRRRRILAGVVACFILVFVFIFIGIGVHNSLQPFEGFIVYPKFKENTIIYKMNDNVSMYVNSLNGILEEYKLRAGDTTVDCLDNTAPLNKEAVCRFNTSHIEAGLTADFGYPDGAPTFILQLRPPMGWQPRVYTNDSTDLSQWKLSKDILPTDHVPVVCQGMYAADQENVGELRLVPKKGIPIKYFPYKGQKDYQYPLVAVQVLHPQVGVLVRLRCELWDLGVVLEDKNPLSVDIYLQVDSGGSIWPWPQG